jgi:hypothetical protein
VSHLGTRIGTVVVGLVVGAILVTSCSGSEGPPPASPSGPVDPAGGVEATAYVTEVCGGILDWTGEIQRLNGELRRAAAGEAAPVEEIKDASLTFFDGVVEATDTLIARVEGAGVPDVPRGAEAAEHVLTGLGDVRDAMRDGRDQVHALDTDDARAFAARLQAITTEMGRTLTAVGTSMEAFEAPELDAAAEATGACEAVPS